MQVRYRKNDWRLMTAIGTGGVVLLAALALAGASPSNVDDGFIVLVYARHLLQTGGVFWNAADGPVDGFTSTLDMLVKAAGAFIAPGDLVRNAHVIAMATFFASVVTGALLVFRSFGEIADALPTPRSRALEAALALVAATGFAFDFALAQAAGFLLEGPLFTWLALSSVGLLVLGDPSRRSTRYALATSCVLFALTRPEGVLLALFVAFWFALVVARTEPRRWEPVAALSLVLAAYLAWHRLRFGAFAPNTFYAKSSDSRWRELVDGAHYVTAYGKSHLTPAVLLTCVFLAPILALAKEPWRDERSRLRFAGAALFTFSAGAIVVVEGGDSYPGGRFLAMPLALVTFTLALAVCGLTGRARFAAMSPLVLLVGTGMVHVMDDVSARVERLVTWPIRVADYECEVAASDVIAKRAATVAQTDFQRIKYHHDELTVIDLSGLNDRARAHSAAPGQNLWGKGGIAAAPASGADVLVLGIHAVHADPMARYSAGRIARDEALATSFIGMPVPPEAREALAASYATASIPECGAYFNVFVRKDIATRFTDAALVGIVR